MAISKTMERIWRDFYAKEAPYWVDKPWALIGTMEAIMAAEEDTPRYRLKKMQWALEAYNQALRERK